MLNILAKFRRSCIEAIINSFGTQYGFNRQTEVVIRAMSDYIFCYIVTINNVID